MPKQKRKRGAGTLNQLEAASRERKCLPRLEWSVEEKREAVRSVFRIFFDGKLRSGCEFRKLIPKKSLKRSIETESKQIFVDCFSERRRQLLFCSSALFFATRLWLPTMENNSGSTSFHFISFYLFIQDCRKEHCTYQATFLLSGGVVLCTRKLK